MPDFPADRDIARFWAWEVLIDTIWAWCRNATFCRSQAFDRGRTLAWFSSVTRMGHGAASHNLLVLRVTAEQLLNPGTGPICSRSYGIRKTLRSRPYAVVGHMGPVPRRAENMLAALLISDPVTKCMGWMSRGGWPRDDEAEISKGTSSLCGGSTYV